MRATTPFGLTILALGIVATQIALTVAAPADASPGEELESPFQQLELDRLEDLSYLLDLGIKRSLGPRTVAFVALSENLVNFGSSADVGLHLGLSRLL